MTHVLDLCLAQVGRDLFDHVLEEQLALRGTLGDHPGDLVVPLGIQRREGQVFQFPLDGVHAQPVRQRGEDLQRLLGLALLLLPGQVAQRAHVVQPVGQLDHQHPDVAGHGDDHLAHGLGLGGLAVLDPVQLGDPVDQRRHVVAEVSAQFGEGVGGVLHGVVQQRGAEGVGVHAELGQDRGHRERVGDVRVAALAHLAGVPVGGHLVGAVDEPDVRLGVGSPDRLDQGFEHRVDPAAAGRAEAGQPAADPGSPRWSRSSRPGRRGGCGPDGVAAGRGPLAEPPSPSAAAVAGGARPGTARRRRLARHLGVLPGNGGFPPLRVGLGDVSGGRAGRCYVTSHMRSCRPPRHPVYRRLSERSAGLPPPAPLDDEYQRVMAGFCAPPGRSDRQQRADRLGAELGPAGRGR